MSHPRPCLLVVDDEQEILDSIHDLFRLDYRVLRARTGEAAERLMETNNVHVVMVDQRMPEMRGTELLARIKQRFPHATRLIFTGYADLQAVIAAINEGNVYRYIAKPWDPAELRVTVAQAFEQYELAAERRRLLDDLQAKNEALQTAIHEREAALRQAQSRAELMAGLAHDLRNPLTIFMGYAVTLLSGTLGSLNERQSDAVERMQSSARYMLNLIRDTLDLVKVESGRDSLYPTEFAVADVVREVYNVVREGAARKHLRVNLDVPDQVRVEADRIKVARILYNLLTNAIKFTPEDGQVDVQACIQNGMLALTIADTGIGIPPEMQTRIFQEFVTLEDGSGSRQIGTGLGLAVCKRLVELHGGAIALGSQPGKGSTFRVLIPAHRPAGGPEE
ncbi:MAG: hybrid sensor histidine kinase/response regulator [Armatimonadetes bacterium]|nr:hybrid sensor histidine kinase/response regulator [Armatimonadota bacterium]